MGVATPSSSAATHRRVGTGDMIPPEMLARSESDEGALGGPLALTPRSGMTGWGRGSTGTVGESAELVRP